MAKTYQYDFDVLRAWFLPMSGLIQVRMADWRPFWILSKTFFFKIRSGIRRSSSISGMIRQKTWPPGVQDRFYVILLCIGPFLLSKIKYSGDIQLKPVMKLCRVKGLLRFDISSLIQIKMAVWRPYWILSKKIFFLPYEKYLDLLFFFFFLNQFFF